MKPLGGFAVGDLRQDTVLAGGAEVDGDSEQAGTGHVLSARPGHAQDTAGLAPARGAVGRAQRPTGYVGGPCGEVRQGQGDAGAAAGAAVSVAEHSRLCRSRRGVCSGSPRGCRCCTGGRGVPVCCRTGRRGRGRGRVRGSGRGRRRARCGRRRTPTRPLCGRYRASCSTPNTYLREDQVLPHLPALHLRLTSRLDPPGSASLSEPSAQPTPAQAIAHLRSEEITLTYDPATRTLTADTPQAERIHIT
jgi:hypothetical protein